MSGNAAWTGFSTTAPAFEGSATNSIGVKTFGITSATARLGFTGLITNLMPYVKGGAAWADDDFDLQNSALAFGAGQVNQTRAGWTLGGGLEYRVLPNWSVTLEYDHYDFGSRMLADFSFSPVTCSPCTATDQIKAGGTVDLFTVGLVYRLGWSPL